MSKRKGGNVNELMEHNKQLEKRIAFQEDRNSKLEKQNTELKREIAVLSRDNDELLNRLSRIAGDHMTHGNPHIADLSDQNRPTKLADKWSSIYTDEWVDAYDELNKKSSTTDSFKVEKHLRDIAVECFGQCQQIANEQLQKLRYTLEDLESYMQNTGANLNLSISFSKSMRLDQRQDPRFIDNIINTYKQRRCRDLQWIEAVKRQCANEYVKRNGTRSKRVLSYVYKCAELCWFMCTHETPMVLEYESYKGQEIDKSKFNLYDSKGTVVDFIVWPALLLKQGNGLSLLAKGVVHPVTSQSSHHKTVTKRKSNDKMDSVVSLSNIHTELPRVASKASTRTPSPNKVTTRKKAGGGSVNGETALAEGTLVEGAVSKSSRISNPEMLFSAGKSKTDKLLSHPDFLVMKSKRDFSKSMKVKPAKV